LIKASFAFRRSLSVGDLSIALYKMTSESSFADVIFVGLNERFSFAFIWNEIPQTNIITRQYFNIIFAVLSS